jgi:hypothetical protein
MGVLGQQQHRNEWRLFIDSSKLTLKAMLLHNRNKYPSVAIAHAVHAKESYNMHHPVKHAQYHMSKYTRYICGDLKWSRFCLTYIWASRNAVSFTTRTVEKMNVTT